MSRIAKIVAGAAIFAGLFATSAQAVTTHPFQGVIIVPASTSPHPHQEGSATQRKQQAQTQINRGEIVAFGIDAAPGSIIINTSQKALYLVIGKGRAAKYRVATAKQGFEWSGTQKVSSKVEWPDWRPPAEMRARRPDLPEFMAGGLDNPLGARAIYLGSSIYRIHGTNERDSIGTPASSGCIRMLNEDVTELYRFVKVGATVTVI